MVYARTKKDTWPIPYEYVGPLGKAGYWYGDGKSTRIYLGRTKQQVRKRIWIE